MNPSKELRQGRYQSRASRRATGSCRHASRFMSARIGPIAPRSSDLIVPHQTINSQPEDLILAGQPESPGRHSAGLLGELFAKRSEALLGKEEREVVDG